LTTESGFERAEPDAAALFESLRAFGYSPESAVADLVDNSITAGSSVIDIQFHWDGDSSYVFVMDDGRGMGLGELRQAMRPGSRNPLEERSPTDLGRFGLGMKTASLSQGRSLTVASKTATSRITVRRWDLDRVGEERDWVLIKTPTETGQDLLGALAAVESGTLVLWEKLDRLASGTSASDRNGQKNFLEVAAGVERHLSMVFHRFLTGRSRINIRINGRAITAWDPFLEEEPATQALTPETLFVHRCPVVVAPYVLAHQSRLTAQRHDLAAGPKGWNAQQGFYVYRNRRLLVAGDWLGLGFRQEEHAKLARIRVDIPNAIDSDWGIDVRKSRARPPDALKGDLRRIARLTRTRAVEVYRHRGRTAVRESGRAKAFIWNRRFRGGQYSYAIDRTHPLVERSLEAAGTNKAPLLALLRQIEETIPYQQIWIDSAEHPDSQKPPFAGSTDNDVLAVMEQIYHALVAAGHHRREVVDRLAMMDPFSERPELLGLLLERMPH
jgi:hypothetical protein